MASDSVMNFGRPREYDPSYCDVVFNHLAQGKSQRAVSGLIGISPQTWYRWKKEYPDFCDAVDIGCSLGLNEIEEGMLKAMHGKNPKFRENIAMFLAVRRFPKTYGDQQEQADNSDKQLSIGKYSEHTAV